METIGIDDAEISALDITFVEPGTGNIGRKSVFCDPQHWDCRWQARFLISADLINLLSEAFLCRKERFRQYHSQLTTCRLGYLCDLWRLRRGIQSVLAALPLDDLEREGFQPGKGEIGPVHFFIPDHYLDSWTVEHLALAINNCRDGLRAQIDALLARLRAIGNGSWLKMLDHILSKGASLPAVGSMIMQICSDPDEKRNVENHVTGGLADKFAALQPIVEELENEVEDEKERGEDVKHALVAKNDQIAVMEEALRAMRRMKMPEVVRRGSVDDGDKDDRGDEAARLAEQLRKLKEMWAKKLAEALAEIERLRVLLMDWGFRLDARDIMDLRRLEMKADYLERQADTIDGKVKECNDKNADLRDKIKRLEDQIAEDEAMIAQLSGQEVDAAPPDPMAFLFVKLQRELRNLQKREAKLREEMEGPKIKIRAVRQELRVLYEKLGWEWDLGDDDDYNDMPYWERRKLATNGLTHFDENLFLFSEKAFHTRRLRKHAVKERSATQITLLQQITAKHYHKRVANTIESFMDDSLLEESAESLGPFKSMGPPLTSEVLDTTVPDDSLVAVPSVSELQQAAEPDDDIGLPHDLHVRLKSCIISFTDLMPQEGMLGAQRKKAESLLQQLPGALQSDEKSIPQLEAVAFQLQACFEEVADLGSHVHQVCGALQNSVEFHALKELLAEICYDVEALHRRSRGNRRRVLIADTPATPSRPSSALQGSRSSPSLERPEGTLLLGKSRRPLAAPGPEVANFGFRPNGAGEESLERWSLFKVSKGSGAKSTTSLRGRASSVLESGRFLETKLGKLQKLEPGCDFKEYMAQVQQAPSPTPAWQPSPLREALEKSKGSLSLPQLVSGQQRGEASPAQKAAGRRGSGLYGTPNRVWAC